MPQNNNQESMLRELDEGFSALTPGSEVVFVNDWPEHETLGPLLSRVKLTSITVRGGAARAINML